MNTNKKKYLLAGIDQNLDQLRGQQVSELTKLLIDLKSEYDKIIRETINKKQSTIEIGVKFLIITVN